MEVIRSTCTHPMSSYMNDCHAFCLLKLTSKQSLMNKTKQKLQKHSKNLKQANVEGEIKWHLRNVEVNCLSFDNYMCFDLS